MSYTEGQAAAAAAAIDEYRAGHDGEVGAASIRQGAGVSGLGRRP